MLELTPTARKVLDAYFKGKPKEPMRVVVVRGDDRSRLSLRKDAKKEDDVVLESGGYTFLIADRLYELAKPLTVDATVDGFDITSSLVFQKEVRRREGGGCGGGCGGCTKCG